ncbi:MAG: response regulator [Elusimicrobia bacterium]|nr:response regulator [Elusimicrobiota bacterium]
MPPPTIESEYDVLIVDDDPLQAAFLDQALRLEGYVTRHLVDGSHALDEARRAKPRLVVVDIVMPGIDGLRVCQALVPDVSARGGAVVVASGKPRAVEEPRALKAGAVAYLQKPFSVPEVLAVLQPLLGKPDGGRRLLSSSSVRVQIWGSRSAGESGSAFGTRSCSISVGLRTGELYLLDAGTGLQACAAALMSHPIETATLLLTHYHPGHVEGLFGLPLVRKPKFVLRVAGPADIGVDLRGFLAKAFESGQGPGVAVQAWTLDEGRYELSDNVVLHTLYANHPTTTLAFALTVAGKKIVYCPDSELTKASEVDLSNTFERLRSFALGADLLIHDAHSAPADLPRFRGQGHSSWEEALRLALEAGVRHLSLFHLAASYSDAKASALETAARQKASQERPSLRCDLARDGAMIDL